MLQYKGLPAWCERFNSAEQIIRRYIYIYLDPPRGAKWMVRGATKQPLRVQTPPLGGCWYIYILFVLFCVHGGVCWNP